MQRSHDTSSNSVKAQTEVSSGSRIPLGMDNIIDICGIGGLRGSSNLPSSEFNFFPFHATFCKNLVKKKVYAPNSGLCSFQ